MFCPIGPKLARRCPGWLPVQQSHLIRTLTSSRPCFDTAQSPKAASASTAKPAEPAAEAPGIPYSNLTVGVPKESYPGERRVAVTPAGVATLLKKGFKEVKVSAEAGAGATFRDEDYTKAGATISSDPFDSDIVLKVSTRLAPNHWMG